MAEITFRRIFHPVGHGAFFTEQFIDPISNITLYNVVYDCGSIKKELIDRIYRISDEMYAHKRYVDVLFLSHFDDDHVKGVKYLVERHYLYNTKLFIPLLKEKSFVGALPYHSNYNYIRNLNGINNIKIIEVDFDSTKNDESEKSPISIENIEKNIISSGTKLSSNHIDFKWLYVPFNICNSELINTFEEKVNAADLDYNKLSSPNYVQANIKEIKKIYQNIGKKPSNGTRINFNSLQLLSYPAKTNICKDFSRHSTCHIYFEDYYRWNKGYTQFKFDEERLYPGSCLYTGDTSANIDNVRKKLLEIIDRHLDRNLVLYQLPHHGSGNSNDNWAITEKKIYAAFTNYGEFKGKIIFDPHFAILFGLVQKPLILITEDDNSMFEEKWKLY